MSIGVDLIRRDDLIHHIMHMIFVIISNDLNFRDQALGIDSPNLNQLIDIVLEALNVGFSHLRPRGPDYQSAMCFFGLIAAAFIIFFVALATASAPKNPAQRSSGTRGAFFALAIARSATSFTIQSKLACPIECMSASGTGFMKSIA